MLLLLYGSTWNDLVFHMELNGIIYHYLNFPDKPWYYLVLSGILLYDVVLCLVLYLVAFLDIIWYKKI